MGQNIPVPNFAAEQQGNTYYFSPLNVYSTGIVDVLTEDMHLYYYTWLEGEGKRGRNNIALVFYKHLKIEGFFDHKNYGDLVLICNNCSGLNKNQMGWYHKQEVHAYSQCREVLHWNENLIAKAVEKKDFNDLDP
eukprot:12721847-Ditylum_brightwellii.AAC.1